MSDETLVKKYLGHTPGPWKWHRPNGDWATEMSSLVDDTGKQVLNFGNSEQFYPTEGTEPNDADALLIADAPMLLTMLATRPAPAQAEDGLRVGQEILLRATVTIVVEPTCEGIEVELDIGAKHRKPKVWINARAALAASQDKQEGT